MTKLGVGAALLGLVCVVVGVACSWPAVALLGVAMLVSLVFALAYVARRPYVEIRREIRPARVTKGRPAIASLELTNRGRRRVPRTVARQPFGHDSFPAVLPRLERGQTEVRTYQLPTSRRGVFTVGPLEVVRADPFELARVTQRHAGDDTIWVRPRILPLRPLPSGPTRHLEGPSRDTSPQGSITFHRLREYVAGDDRRMIHWKSTARTGRLMVRHNVDTSQPFTVVVLDVHPARYSAETFETAVDVAASVVTCAARGKSPVQLRLTNGEQVGGRRTHDPGELIDHLTGVEPNEDGSVAAALLPLRRERGGTALVVVTGVLRDDVVAHAAVLRRRFERIVVVSIADAPGTPMVQPFVRVINARTADEFARAWDLEAAR